MSGPLLVERREAACWLRLNRPDALNSLTDELIEDIDKALDAAESDVDIRVVVISAQGKAFCAGADLTELPDLRRVGEVFDRIEGFAKPVIVAVHGIAVAGGLELLLCADLVVAARSARFGDSHANYGLLPGAGGSIRLPRRIGTARAKHLMFTGKVLPAASFVDTDLVTVLTEDDELVEQTEALVKLIARKSPLGIAAMKQLVDKGSRIPVAEGLLMEQELAAAHAHSQDFAEGLRAFNEKRAPVFTGR